MAYTKDELTVMVKGLDAMIVSGVRSATVGGQTVTYNTSASLIAARDGFLNQLNALNGVRRPRQQYGFQNGRGYD